MLEIVILGTLYTTEMTGYDIRKCIENGIGMFYKASYGSIYPILGKLLENGHVVCVDEAQGKRVKKKYTITESGKTAFLEWLNEDENNNSSIELFMAKVFFFDKLPQKAAREKISRYEEKLLEYKQNLMEKKETYEALDNKETFYFKISTLYFGICKLQSMIIWCEAVKSGKNLETLV